MCSQFMCLFLGLPKCPGECPTGSPRKWGVSDGVSHGMSRGLFWHRAPECPKSVPRLSPGCQKVSGHSGTLSGHFLDTQEPGARRALETPGGHSVGTPPIFGDTLSDTLRESWPERLLCLLGEFATECCLNPLIIWNVTRIALEFYMNFAWLFTNVPVAYRKVRF